MSEETMEPRTFEDLWLSGRAKTWRERREAERALEERDGS